MNPIDIPSDEELALKAFSPIAENTKNSNNIYVFIGHINLIKARENLEPINTRLYKDLETGQVKKVNPLYLSEFKKRYNVIDIEYRQNIEYDNLRKEFFLSLTFEQQDIAVKKLLKKI